MEKSILQWMKVKKKNWTTPTLELPYGGFDDVAMGAGNEEEEAGEDDQGDDAFGDAICDAQREYEIEKEKSKFECMLEDHRKSLYPTAEAGQKKLGTTVELL